MPTVQVFIFCPNTWDMLNMRWRNGWFLDIHHETWYLSECYRFWFSFTNCSSWSSGPYSEVVSWFLVQFSFSNCLWIPEIFAIWSTLGFVSILLSSKSIIFSPFLWKMIEDSLKIRQVTKFVSCVHKVASFWKLKQHERSLWSDIMYFIATGFQLH